MQTKTNIRKYLTEHREEIVKTLMELIKISSVRGDAAESSPFGEACAAALKYTKSLYEKSGFDCELDGDGGYLLSYYGDGNRTLGLFAHSDVVPAGNDWIYTKPFDPIIKDGFLIGRGAIDDKSAIVISLYCAKMLKELNIPFASRLVMFTGSAEESGMNDIKNYLKNHTPPDFSLVVDTGFPLYRGNKGILKLRTKKTCSFSELKSFIGGGGSTNVAEATAVLYYSDDLYNWLESRNDARVEIAVENGDIVIRALGIAKHSALPEGSVNAAVLICELLAECEMLDEKTRDELGFIGKVASDYYGGNAGIDNVDADFGKLTFVNYGIDISGGGIAIDFNIRHGAAITQSEIKIRLESIFGKKGYSVDYLYEGEAHIVDADHPMLRALMDVYIEYTKDADAKMRVNAGGTYARFLPCAAEIGPSIMGGKRPFELPSGHGQVHEPDECISVDGLLNAIELTMLMLLECDKRQED